jgi:hypothetical protein
MGRLRPFLRPLTAVAFLALLAFSGCAARKAGSAPGAAPGGGLPSVRGTLPDNAAIVLALSPGMSWKSRFLSTSDVKRTLTGPDGKTSVRNRTVGLELISTQTVKRLDGTVAQIEVREHSVRILQEGRFVEAPFRRLGPPDPVFFSVDTATGKLDFTAMEKAYGDWMTALRAGPAGEIFGKSFRQAAYVNQIKERYGTPFSRFAGKTLMRESRALGEKEYILPFLGPGAALGPIPIVTVSRIEGIEGRGDKRLLAVAGSYTGKGGLAPGELAPRLADFGLALPSSYRSSEETNGEFRSAVEMVTGREYRSTGRLRYLSSASFDGTTFSEEILGRTELEPAD